MSVVQSNDSKEKTLHTLRIIRSLQLFGAIVTSAATLAFIAATALTWLQSGETWWSGLAYCFLIVQVMVIYTWFFACLADSAGWNFPIPEWLAVIVINLITFGPICLFPVFCTLAMTETKSPPLVNCFLAIGTFIASLFFSGGTCETSLDIRKKLDPNFKICRGFS